MKRTGIALLIAAAFFLLTACAGSGQSNVYVVDTEEHIFTVDMENGTITDEEETVYQFTITGTNSVCVTITYPDGSTYWWTTQQANDFGMSMGYGGWSDDYDPDRYVDGDTLIDLLGAKAAPSSSSSSHPFLGFILILLGLWNLISPRSSWYVSYGWRFKDAEPSDAALAVARFGGGCAIVIGLIVMFA